jgi:allantoin racemase
MRLGVILPAPNLDLVALREREDAYRKFATEGTEILVEKVEGGPESTDSRYEKALAGPHIIGCAEKLATKDPSALVVNCFGDPSVGVLREIFDFPIIGPGEASIFAASQLGDMYSILTILPNGIPMIRERVQQIGMSQRLASIRAINIEFKELARQTQRMESALLEQGKLAIKNDGAAVLIVGCNSPEMAMTASKLSSILDVPVVNPIAAAVNSAESLARQGLRNSRRTYVTPISRSQV